MISALQLDVFGMTFINQHNYTFSPIIIVHKNDEMDERK